MVVVVCRSRRVVFVAFLLLSMASLACAPEPDGAVVFTEHCSLCHLDPLFPRALPIDMMQSWNPDLIVTALSSGLMEEQGRELSARERRAVADFITLGVADDDLPRREPTEVALP